MKFNKIVKTTAIDIIVYKDNLVNAKYAMIINFFDSNRLGSNERNMAFYDVFCKLSELKGISPSKAAIEIGINKSNVAAWKRDGSIPRSEPLKKIANYFGVSTDYLLNFTNEDGQSDDDPLTFTNTDFLEEDDFDPHKLMQAAIEYDKKERMEIGLDEYYFKYYLITRDMSDKNRDELLKMAEFLRNLEEKDRSK